MAGPSVMRRVATADSGTGPYWAVCTGTRASSCRLLRKSWARRTLMVNRSRFSTVVPMRAPPRAVSMMVPTSSTSRP